MYAYLECGSTGDLDDRYVIRCAISWHEEMIITHGQLTVFCWTKILCLTINPFVHTYEIPKTLRLLYVYVHGLCDRNMGLLPPSNRHFAVSPHEVFTCFRSAWHPLHQMFTNRKKSGVYSKLSAIFGEFWKITNVGPSSIHRLAWNTTANNMDFLP